MRTTRELCSAKAMSRPATTASKNPKKTSSVVTQRALATVKRTPLTSSGRHGRRAAGVMARVSRVTRQVAHAEAADFNELKSALNTTQGNLSIHLRKLEEAGYVAIDHVVGTLGGRAGSFMLQHTGSMNRGAPTLSISVVPDSGTGQLVGLTGKLVILVEDGKHRYEFDYSLPESA